ncbi:hypothetical protein BT63DRAFT_117795 [Microthyrium microscopicum]|uniref:SH3 domain-containing protein n=1 Tax=Microthyrium microscopicum TaxID=703497 RepID=A0A6A6TVC4_9PEZI|nr:hypothetical protein BT63DRAFT_117795 [Microthyrium microscopicum]
MTRPSIVRADTIDLQDQNSPSAQDHSKSHLNGGPVGQAAPHQAAELRHVQNERHAEEVALSNAWSHNGQGLSDEPPSEDDDMYARAEQLTGDTLVHHNGDLLGPSEGSDTGDDEDPLGDDMERASSSPSITDGGLPQFLWPRRSSSLTPIQTPVGTPTRDSFGASVRNSLLNSSSPFPNSLSRDTVPRYSSPIFGSDTDLCSDEVPDQSSSPFVSSPEDLSCFLSRSTSLSSPRHHHWGEYTTFKTTNDLTALLSPENDNDFAGQGKPSAEEQALADEERDELTPLLSEQEEYFSNGLQHRRSLSRSPTDKPLPRLPSPTKEGYVGMDHTVAKERITENEVFERDQETPTKKSAAGTSEAASLIAENDSEDDSDWLTESEDGDSFDSLLFNDDEAKVFKRSLTSALYFTTGWNAQSLQETEDIDFDLVYALHSFVATVEGQANAAKGDTMVLLDDSNSYWWLVRVMKDSTIGYLPAEHIETPTERLARLNKHRNIDATKMHFEDSLEKPRNPLKRAMRRRNQKQVAFAEPTYRDAPVYDYTSDEEEEDEEGEMQAQTNGQTNEAQMTQEEDYEDEDEITAVAPLNVRSTVKDPQQPVEELAQEVDQNMGLAEEQQFNEDGERVGPSRSRNGTVRNTDSFFKDDTAETRKITITPKLLRDENGSTMEVTRASNSMDRGSSFDFSDKPDRKEDKNTKKKKGMFNIFKRSKSDKKYKEESVNSTKTSSEFSRESPAPTSGTVSPAEKISLDNGVQRKGSKGGKLQKTQQPNGPTNGQQRQTMSPNGLRPLQLSVDHGIEEKLSNDSMRDANGGQRLSPEKQMNGSATGAPFAKQSNNPFADTNGISQVSRVTEIAPDALSESPVHITAADAHPDSEPPALVRDSSSDSDDVRSLRDSPSPPMQNGTIQHTQHAQHEGTGLGLQHSPMSSSMGVFGGVALAGAASLGGLAIASREQPPPPSREPPPQPNGFGSINTTPGSMPDRQNSTSTTTSAILSSAPSTPVWSDASLRQYMDESGSSDIRDLLVLTRDTTGVVPVSANHPLMAGLYSEERGQVKEMDDTLNELLSTYIERKVRSRSAQSQRKRL